MFFSTSTRLNQYFGWYDYSIQCKILVRKNLGKFSYSSYIFRGELQQICFLITSYVRSYLNYTLFLNCSNKSVSMEKTAYIHSCHYCITHLLVMYVYIGGFLGRPKGSWPYHFSRQIIMSLQLNLALYSNKTIAI